MRLVTVRCPVCGNRFDPTQHAGCRACPLHRGCRTTCCPACGHAFVDHTRSRLARSLAVLLDRLRGRDPQPAVVSLDGGAGGDPARNGRTGANWNVATVGAGRCVTLADLRPGARGRVLGLEGIAPVRQERLLAYGLTPGRQVRVVQQAPVTVVQVEHTELALENDLARRVRVEETAEPEAMVRSGLPDDRPASLPRGTGRSEGLVRRHTSRIALP